MSESHLNLPTIGAAGSCPGTHPTPVLNGIFLHICLICSHTTMQEIIDFILPCPPPMCCGRYLYLLRPKRFRRYIECWACGTQTPPGIFTENLRECCQGGFKGCELSLWKREHSNGESRVVDIDQIIRDVKWNNYVIRREWKKCDECGKYEVITEMDMPCRFCGL